MRPPREYCVPSTIIAKVMVAAAMVIMDIGTSMRLSLHIDGTANRPESVNLDFL